MKKNYLYSSFLIILCTFLISCTKEYKITIKSVPDHVEVTDVKRGKLGFTNLEKLVSSKKSEFPNLNLTFSKPGYVEKKIDLLKIKHDQTVMVTLHSAPTYLHIESIPPSAKIKIFNKEGLQLQFIDNSKISRKYYFANKRLKISNNLNKVLLQLNHNGYKPFNQEITIEPHKENRFSFQLEKINPILKVNSIPSGAEVYDKTLGFLGRTPLSLNLSWNQLIRLSQEYDAMNTSSINFHLTLKKDNHQTKEIIQEFQIYNHNPIIWVNLIKNK